MPEMKTLPLKAKQPSEHARPVSVSGWTSTSFLLLVIATFVAFHQVFFADFVNWDDDLYVYDNPHLLHDFGDSAFRWALAETNDGNWIPLTRLSLLADYKLYGLRPWGFHLTSLLL